MSKVSEEPIAVNCPSAGTAGSLDLRFSPIHSTVISDGMAALGETWMCLVLQNILIVGFSEVVPSGGSCSASATSFHSLRT